MNVRCINWYSWIYIERQNNAHFNQNSIVTQSCIKEGAASYPKASAGVYGNKVWNLVHANWCPCLEAKKDSTEELPAMVFKVFAGLDSGFAMTCLIHWSRLTCMRVYKSISFKLPLSMGRMRVLYALLAGLLFHKRCY